MFYLQNYLFGSGQVLWSGKRIEIEEIEDSKGQTFLSFDSTPSLF
jgi:hypothetical protein